MMDIEELPDFPSLQQLSRSLWRRHAERRGAAVLVGAGFSRNADRAAGDTPLPPLWSDLHTKMATMLYPSDPGRAPSDALRLAEEFRAYFGQASLDDFIRSNICDDSWYPSKAHGRLLELPWSDVLTTNWDTLLERAARKVASYNYEFVHSSSDLIHARAPRVVKLHGTVGGAERYIFAEEDYRTYPQRNAAFVNFARQVFIENELCLIGFSGDDPNFLQWSGWVRDHLASSSRRIYLVGVLRLPPAKRKLLELRNVAPIDLAPLVDSLSREDQHVVATDLLLGYLEGSRTIPAYSWMPLAEGVRAVSEAELEREGRDPNFAATRLVEQAHQWKAERESYPGWLICPHEARRALRWGCSSALQQLRTAGDALKARDRESVLIELAWRFEGAMMPLPAFFLTALAGLAVDIEKTTLDREQRRLLVFSLLRTAREQEDEAAFLRWSAAMEQLSRTDPEAQAENVYQRCLRLRDRMDLAALEENLALLHGQDPVWKLRRAFLLCELRRWREAEILLLDVLGELRDRENDARDSLWARSRRAWAQWLASAAARSFRAMSETRELLPRDFSRETESKCNPWTEIESLASEVREAHRKRLAEESERFMPMFEPGSYRNDANTIRFVSDVVVSPDYVLRRFMESAGIPMTIDHVHLLPFAADAIWLRPETTTRWYLGLVHYASQEKEPLVVRFLGRTSIATLPANVAKELVQVVLCAIDYWRKRAHEAVSFQDRVPALEALTNLVSMLYRLTPRMDDDTAAQCFQLGLDLGSDRKLLHHWLVEPVSNLLRHSARAMSVGARLKEALAAAEFPLAAELDENFSLADRWPNPLDDLLFKPFVLVREVQEARWSARVRRLLELATPGGNRAHAILRLATLAIADVLQREELVALGEVLWAQTDESQAGLPSGTHLLPHIFAVLPAPTGVDSVARVSRRLFDDDAGIVNNVDRLGAIFYAAAYKVQPLFPTSAQAMRLFDGIVEHCTEGVATTEPQALFGRTIDELRDTAGRALSLSIVPALDGKGRTEERGRRLLELTVGAQLWSAIAGLPYFAACGEEFSQLVVERISEGMMGASYEEVASSAWAIEVWQTLFEEGESSPILSRLMDAAVSTLEARRDTGLPQVVRCCRKLLTGGVSDPAFLRRMARAAVSLALESEYAKVDPTERRAISVSMVRAECALLAKELLQRMDDPSLEAWLDQAKTDPLPEVRFVVANA